MGEYKKGDWVVVIKGHNWIDEGAIIQVSGRSEEGMRHYYNNTEKPGAAWYFDDSYVRPATDAEIRAAGGQVTGSGVKRKLSEIKSKAAVWCKDKNEANEFCKLLMQLPEYKKEKLDVWQEYWYKYSENQCYSINGTIGYGYRAWYMENNIPVYPASDFIETGMDKAYNQMEAYITQPVMVTEDNWYAGMRVVRNPSKWHYGDQDRNMPGTILSINAKKNHVRVRWDSWSGYEGIEDNYRLESLCIYQEQTSNNIQSQIKTNTNEYKNTEGSSIVFKPLADIRRGQTRTGTPICGRGCKGSVISGHQSYHTITVG